MKSKRLYYIIKGIRICGLLILLCFANSIYVEAEDIDLRTEEELKEYSISVSQPDQYCYGPEMITFQIDSKYESASIVYYDEMMEMQKKSLDENGRAEVELCFNQTVSLIVNLEDHNRLIGYVEVTCFDNDEPSCAWSINKNSLNMKLIDSESGLRSCSINDVEYTLQGEDQQIEVPICNDGEEMDSFVLTVEDVVGNKLIKYFNTSDESASGWLCEKEEIQTYLTNQIYESNDVGQKLDPIEKKEDQAGKADTSDNQNDSASDSVSDMVEEENVTDENSDQNQTNISKSIILLAIVFLIVGVGYFVIVDKKDDKKTNKKEKKK